MIDKEVESEIDKVSVSNNTISRRVDDCHTTLKMSRLKY
jgi:hypothetical protein